MKNRYQEMQNRHHKEFESFPLGAAFDKRQWKEMMERWGLKEDDTDKIYSIGGGCYIRKSDADEFHAIMNRFEQERKDAIAADKTGEGFIYEMFRCELANHEYGYTGELDETLDALDLTVDEINADKRLLRGLEKALRDYKEK